MSKKKNIVHVNVNSIFFSLEKPVQWIINSLALTNPIFPAFSLGLVLVCISLFYILSNSHFVAGAPLLIYMGAINVLILFAVMFMNGSEYYKDFNLWIVGNGLTSLICTSLFCFTNYYYFKYNMVWDYLDYKSKPDYRARFGKLWFINRFFSSIWIYFNNSFSCFDRCDCHGSSVINLLNSQSQSKSDLHWFFERKKKLLFTLTWTVRVNL